MWNFGPSLALPVSLLLKKRGSPRGAGVPHQRAPGRHSWSASVQPRLMMAYDMYIPIIYHWSVKDALCVLVSCHMSWIYLWHAWSDVCQLFHCFFYFVQALNLNSIYEQDIPVQTNHMSDIFHVNDFSTVTSEWMIFLLCKLQYTNVHYLCNGCTH